MSTNEKINREDLKKYLKQLKENEEIVLNTDQDVLKPFIVPMTDDSKSYRGKKVYLVNDKNEALLDDSGKARYEFIPEEIQTNSRRIITPNLTTANLTEWPIDQTKVSKRTVTDEEYCFRAYQLINSARYMMARDPRIDLNSFIDIIQNEIDFITSISKSRGGLLLTASRTNRTVNETVGMVAKEQGKSFSAIDAFNGKSRKPNMQYIDNLDQNFLM